MEGNLLEGDKPSKEAVFHLAMYQKNPECKAIVHLHSTYLTALSCLENLDPSNAMKAFTPYYVMRVGKMQVSDLLDAADNTEELEETAKLFFTLQGQKIRYLTDEEIQDLEHRGK